MILTLEELRQTAAVTGFQEESLEKVIRLIGLLNAIQRHPYLRSRVALKGGTALNLFVFELPRLSVDIDLNYIGATDRETMMAERGPLEQALRAVCEREGLTPKRTPGEHAGGKWRITYINAFGRNANLELDVNFTLRVPLWPVQRLDTYRVGAFQARQIPVLDAHELAAGKLAALLSRTASRDLYDAGRLLQWPELDLSRLRLGFVVYGAINRRDWRAVHLDDLHFDVEEVRRFLVPVLRAGIIPQDIGLAAWLKGLEEDCRRGLSRLLPLDTRELAFLEAINQHGEIRPEFLTDDEALVERLRHHPGLLWKALNVRKHSDAGGKQPDGKRKL